MMVEGHDLGVFCFFEFLLNYYVFGASNYSKFSLILANKGDNLQQNDWVQKYQGDLMA